MSRLCVSAFFCLIIHAIAYQPLTMQRMHRSVGRRLIKMNDASQNSGRAAHIQVGTGDYVTVTKISESKKRRRHSHSTKTDSLESEYEYRGAPATATYEAQATTVASGTGFKPLTLLTQPMNVLGSGYEVAPIQLFLPAATVGLFSYKRIKTGDWLSWASVRHTSGAGRRSVIQRDSQLGAISQMSCQECGYTIFPAKGRNWRYFDESSHICPLCGSDKFYDKNDPDDPRNIAEDGKNLAYERRDQMKKWILADASKVAELTEKAREEDALKRSIYNREVDVGNEIGAAGITNGPMKQGQVASLAEQLATAGAKVAKSDESEDGKSTEDISVKE